MAFGLFKKKKKQEKKDNRYFDLVIREVVEVAKDAVNVVFEEPPEAFHYQPGQFLTIIQTINGQVVRRAYSLCTNPFTDKYPAVTVKRVPGGVMSNYINDHFKTGEKVKIMEPMGNFTTEFTLTSKRNAVFIGGGSGITPLMSILKTSLSREPNSHLTLVYGNRSKEYIIFKKELDKLAIDYADRFKIIHVLEQDEENLTEFKGRPTEEMIGFICDKIGINLDTEFYICGPEPMMKIAHEGLRQIGISDDKVKMESFEAGKSPKAEKDVEVEEELTGQTSEVTILLDGQEYSIQVPMKQPILEAGLENGLDMPYSCQSGLCTACRGKCLEGSISLDEAEGITQAEIEEGYVLLCVGKPQSSKIKVEIG